MNARPCKKLNGVGGLGRCVEPWGHDRGPRPTQHSDGEGTTWGDEWKEAPVARARIKAGQPDQWGTVEQAYRAGRKDERIRAMMRSNGAAYCEARALDLGECPVLFTDETSARSGLDYAHLRRRARAQGYRPGRGGQNDALFALLCRSHHDELDGSVVQFSGKKAAS